MTNDKRTKLDFIRKTVTAILLFAAQKTWAQTPQLKYGVPSDAGFPVIDINQDYYYRPSFTETLIRFLLPLTFILIVLSGIISPVIGYIWYIKHGGTKKWIGWLAFLPLALTIVWLLALLLDNII